jgi:hypothetical protein
VEMEGEGQVGRKFCADKRTQKDTEKKEWKRC